MKRSTHATLLLSLLLSAPALAKPLTVKGSDTMVVLGQQWAEQYMKAHPETEVQVTGGGSGTGISALINGTTDICQASRPMKQAEKDQLKQKYSSEGVEIPVAKDGVSIYVNSANPVNELSIEQLKGIYTGKITNWKEVGGPDAKIALYSRENSSGTYVFFREEVLKEADFSPRAQGLPGTAAVVNAVARDKNGVGYGGAAYAKGIKVLKVKKDAASAAIAADESTVQNGTYPLSRSLYFYTREKPAGEAKLYVEWVLGAEGQALAKKVGYFPIK
ncbi:MAG: phosphate ABC transporter substrate-binding protein [Myxococcota bacterium]